MAESERGGLGAPDVFVALHNALGLACYPWGLGEGLAEEDRRGSTGSFLLFAPLFSLREGLN